LILAGQLLGEQGFELIVKDLFLQQGYAALVFRRGSTGRVARTSSSEKE
jgi:hypothetical protein